MFLEVGFVVLAVTTILQAANMHKISETLYNTKKMVYEQDIEVKNLQNVIHSLTIRAEPVKVEAPTMEKYAPALMRIPLENRSHPTGASFAENLHAGQDVYPPSARSDVPPTYPYYNYNQ